MIHVPIALAPSVGMIHSVNSNPTNRRVYDHRIRRAICTSGNSGLFPELEIPRPTAMSWIRRGCPEVVELNRTTGVHVLGGALGATSVGSCTFTGLERGRVIEAGATPVLDSNTFVECGTEAEDKN